MKNVGHLKAILHLLKVGLIVVASLIVITIIASKVFGIGGDYAMPPLDTRKSYQFMLLFVLIFGPLVYGFNCFLARQWIKPPVSSLVLHMGLLLLCGSSIEILVDTIANSLLGRPLWVYHIWPVHDDFTSGTHIVVWPLYGVHLCLFHMAMKIRKSPLISTIPIRGVMLAFDAMFLEVIMNVFALSLFNSFYFYYLSDDLFHFTSREVFIPYVASGLFGMTLLKYLDRPSMPRFWIGIVCYVVGILHLFVWS